jgi:putative radical SAM enzyme (TIGR03279 family)
MSREGKSALFEVKNVAAGSPAALAGIQPGDQIISINGEPLIDYVDYVYFCAQEKLRFYVLRGGRKLKIRARNDDGGDLGLEFTQPLLGKKRVCGNRCIFCFVEQLPKGMRRSLYIKDEDWRYSLVFGNYVTLSDIGKKEFRRILKRKASPLNISVHTVDEALRRHMLGNPRGLAIRPMLRKIAAAGMRFHAQAVICPGYNDGAKLEETFLFLKALYPAAMSLAVVPVGLTGHREGLTPLEPVTPEMARRTIKEVENWQKECLNSIGTRFVFASDEYYLRAGLPLPAAEEYEDYCQIENGVGLVARLLSQVDEALESAQPGSLRHVSLATGVDALPIVRELAERAGQKLGVRVSAYAVDNLTFGGGVTVAGLLGGRDFLRALEGKELGERLLIPAVALRDDGIFLDDMTLSELEEALGVPVFPAADAFDLVSCMAGQPLKEKHG